MTDQRKYEFVKGTKRVRGHTVRRIRRLYDGKLGGWISRESNLCHANDCWVDQTSCVLGYAKVTGHAKVQDNSILIEKNTGYHTSVSGHAQVINTTLQNDSFVANYACVQQSHLKDTASVTDNAKVIRSSLSLTNVSGDAQVFDSVCVGHDGYVNIRNNAYITEAYIRGDIVIGGHAFITGDVHIQGKVLIGQYASIGSGLANPVHPVRINGDDIVIDGQAVIRAGVIGSNRDFVHIRYDRIVITAVRNGSFVLQVDTRADYGRAGTDICTFYRYPNLGELRNFTNQCRDFSEQLFETLTTLHQFIAQQFRSAGPTAIQTDAPLRPRRQIELRP